MIRAISLAFLCAVSFAAVYWAMAPAEDAVVAPAPATTSEGVAAEPAAAAPAEPQQTASLNTIRDVTPANITAAPPVSGPLVRIEPPKPEEPEKPARVERLFNPIVVSAGAIQVGDDEIRLAGLSVTDPERTCGEGAATWPCGRVARAMLRRFIRGRAIECEVPAGADAIPEPAHCLVGGDDISAWLVAQGWAEASGDYADAGKAARDGKLGVYADSRPDAQPDEVAARR